ncbi:MAG: Tetratricopeptide repeat-containing protein [Gemmatimonadetes bacterium]|nr:Tetratricopeptide repeat-containing protein [Gemmatimonadota bacterium]
MTSIRPDAESAAADRAQTFVDWTRINARMLTGGAVLIVVAGAGFWFYGRSKQLQAANAEKALMTAKQSMTAGNLPLAQTDLQKVFAKYASTSAGVEAAMLLAQIDYDAGKFQDGISILQKVSGTSAANGVEPTVRSLEGDGYAQMGKLTDAAKQYESAADATGYETEKAFQRAKAARAYQTAGDTAKARQIWTDMSTDPKYSTMAAEARVRLGELTAKVASK